MSQVEHMEVAPRMWDKTIAATYDPKPKSVDSQDASSSEEDTIEAIPADTTTAVVAAASKGSLFFARLKSYLIPALFVIALIVVVYVFWKYFTKYRNTKKESDHNLPIINESDITPNHSPKKTTNPTVLIQSQDMSKYEYDSAESEEESEDEDSPPRLEIIEEISKDGSDADDSSSESSEESAESIDSESSESSESDEEVEEPKEVTPEPDISEIQQLISTDTSMPILEDDYSFDIPSYVDEEEQPATQVVELSTSKPKRPARKTKRVTL